MIHLLSLLLACTLTPAGVVADTGVDSSVDSSVETGLDTGADTADSCGATAPTATLDVSIYRTIVGSGPGTVRTKLWWIELGIGGADPDGDLAQWSFDLWRATGDEALDTDRPADLTEAIDETVSDEAPRPPCGTSSVVAGRAWVLSEDPTASLLIPEAPFELAVAVTDASHARSEIVSVSGVAPRIGR